MDEHEDFVLKLKIKTADGKLCLKMKTGGSSISNSVTRVSVENLLLLRTSFAVPHCIFLFEPSRDVADTPCTPASHR